MTDTDTKYNGWTNYETWLIALWIDNEEGSSDYWREAACEAWTDSGPGRPNQFIETHERNAVGILAERLKDEFSEAMPDLGANFWSDLLNAGLGEVDWYDVAKHYIDDLDDQFKESTSDDEEAGADA